MSAIGPLVTDGAFFTQHVNTGLPGMEGIPEAARRGDFAAARRLFAAQVRASVKPQTLLSIPYVPEGTHVMLPNEDPIAAAERVLTHNLISVGVPHQFGERIDYFHNPTFNQYKEWTWQLSRHSEWKLLAYAYHKTGDERYAACCADLFRQWVAQAACPEVGTGGGDTLCWRTIEAGIRMGSNWQYALHAFIHSPHFTDDVLTDWYKSVYEHGVRLRADATSANWLLMEMDGLGQIGLLYPQLKDAPMWRAFAFEVMEKELDRQFYADGFHYELSTAYHEVSLSCYIRLLRVGRSCGASMPHAFLEKLESAVALYLKLAMPDGRTPNLNDGWYAPVREYLENYRDLFPHRADFAWYATRGGQGAPPAFVSVALPYSGYFVMRSGWGEDAVYGMLDAAPFGRGHQHEDKLSVLIYANGALVLTEGGIYPYDDSQMRRYVLSTRAHNTVRVDGQDQNRRQAYCWDGADIAKDAGMAHAIAPELDAARGTYAEGYGEDAGRLAVHERSVYFIKKHACAGRPFFVVVDRLRADEPRRFEILWHLDTASLKLDGLRADTPVMCVAAAGPDGLSADAVYAQKTPDWQGWRGTGQIQGDFLPVYALRYFAQGRDVRVVTLFFPSDEETCPFLGVEASGDVRESGFALVLRDGTRVPFDERAMLKRQGD